MRFIGDLNVLYKEILIIVMRFLNEIIEKTESILSHLNN